MPGLSAVLNIRCRDTLLKCSEFDRDSSLRAVFVTKELYLYRYGVPGATSKKDRVDGCVDYLLPRRLSDGRPVLPIFLAALRDRYHPGNGLRDELESLRLDVEMELSQQPAPVPLPSRPASGDTPVDFLILTALEEERDAIRNRLPDCRKLSPSHEDVRVYYSSDLPATFPNGSTCVYHVILMPLLDMGRVQATSATVDAIRRWHPRYVILVGIAGGVAARGVHLGDVLVANQIVDYELQKLTPDGPDIRWVVHQVDPGLLGATRNLDDELWRELISVNRPGRGMPNRHTGPIISGDKVIAFGEILVEYRKNWSKLIGVEMEAGGVATAAFQAAESPGFLMVRGVSDLADEEKNSAQVEKWRLYACDVAATYAIALLKSGPIPLS